MLRALLIWFCFTEISKTPGSSSRSAWSPWHFSENLDQLGTWYIYILGINSKHIRKLPSVEIGSKKWSSQINPAVVKWTWWFATHLITFISEDNDAFFFKNEQCFFYIMVSINTFCWSLSAIYVHAMITVHPMITPIRWPPPRSRVHPGAREPRNREWWKIHFLCILVVAILWVPPLGKSLNVLDEYAFQD